MKSEEYKNKLVAFIDILGFSDIINQTIENDIKVIHFFNEHISHILNVLKDDYNKMFSLRLFSDCICISCDNNLTELEFLLTELAYIQFYFSINGIFIRGGLTTGEHFENDNIIYSKGLIKSYELEKQSIYPRIIIEDSLAETIKKANFGSHVDNGFMMKSPDNKYFLDYLDYLYLEGMEQEDFMLEHKNSIINQVKRNSNNSKILDKYKWLSEYHNVKFHEFFEKDDYYEDAYLEIENKLIINIKNVFPDFEK